MTAYLSIAAECRTGLNDLQLKGDWQSWAVTSLCGRYRYCLGRGWDESLPFWCFVMCNPSTARHDVDDATQRKCSGFASRGGAGGYVIVNVMAYSDTHPENVVKAWRSGVDVFGPYNMSVLYWALSQPFARTVAGWGKLSKPLREAAKRGIDAVETFAGAGVECFGRNGDGSPTHPLTLAYSTPIVPYMRSATCASAV